MKRRMLSRILSLALAAMCLLPVLAQAEEYATVQGGGLNLREKADLNAKVLGQYWTGTWVEIVEKGEEWCKVKVAGKDGYM
ncbi:MAG: SH3 domain-containing protein, partial [Clostridia bacterium]|nr:SH3 domain-containing protein [Clostridia bacterium]